MKSSILVFGRQPIPSRVKTCLASRIGEENAARVYAELLQYSLEVAVQSGRETVLLLAEPATTGWAPPLPVAVEVQVGEDLGSRLRNAFQQRFSTGDEYVIVIGSDCPELRPRHIGEASSRLADLPVVLGPTRGGGYYLIGQRAPGVDLFSDVHLSETDALEQTRKRLIRLGVEWSELGLLGDFEHLADLAYLLTRSTASPELVRRVRGALPPTALSRIGLAWPPVVS